MNWEEIKECINEWIWDNELGTYFWILRVEEETKMLWVKGLAGRETKVFFSAGRYFKDVKKGNDII